MIEMLEYYSNRLAQEVHVVQNLRGPHRLIEPLNWSDILAYST